MVSEFEFVSEAIVLKQDNKTGVIISEKDDGKDQPSLDRGGNGPVFRLFSDFLIVDRKEVGVLVEKACYAEEIYRIVSDTAEGGKDKNRVKSGFLPIFSRKAPEKARPAAVIYPSYEAYLSTEDEELKSAEEIVTEALLDLSDIRNFRQFITSGFDARFFNALSGDEYTVVKSSVNKEKIRAEYEYYRLLPEEMRMWFAQAFNYKEDENEASYTMERFHMTDLALRFVHGAIEEEEFRQLMDKLFFFLLHRKSREVSEEELSACRKKLYVNKVEERVEKLKGLAAYAGIEAILKTASDPGGLDAILKRYFDLYDRYEKIGSELDEPCLVVGHGDLCFSNILYNKDANLLRLIDPKGAMSEEELYTDPYYDLAKLSHSICGSYDYFNSGLFEISLSEENRLELTIDEKNKTYRRIFREYAEKNFFDYIRIRIYEASLFLSMLPLHIDRPKKVLGFILNAEKILDEVCGMLHLDGK